MNTYKLFDGFNTFIKVFIASYGGWSTGCSSLFTKL